MGKINSKPLSFLLQTYIHSSETVILVLLSDSRSSASTSEHTVSSCADLLPVRGQQDDVPSPDHQHQSNN